jgi:putative ABC transport system permease protein
MVEQRSKEISIRKVLGASIPNLFMLLTRRFMLLVLVSIVLALPIAWYLILKWMQDYEYSTTINSVPFLAAGLTLILVALIAISNQALKATLRSPIEAIKNE